MYRYFRYMCPRGGNRDTCQRHRLMLACRAWLKATIPLLQRGFGVSNCSILSIRISGSSKRRSTRLDYRVQSRLLCTLTPDTCRSFVKRNPRLQYREGLKCCKGPPPLTVTVLTRSNWIYITSSSPYVLDQITQYCTCRLQSS